MLQHKMRTRDQTINIRLASFVQGQNPVGEGTETSCTTFPLVSTTTLANSTNIAWVANTPSSGILGSGTSSHISDNSLLHSDCILTNFMLMEPMVLLVPLVNKVYFKSSKRHLTLYKLVLHKCSSIKKNLVCHLHKNQQLYKLSTCPLFITLPSTNARHLV